MSPAHSHVLLWFTVQNNNFWKPIASVYALIVIAKMNVMYTSPEFMYTCPHVVDMLFKMQQWLQLRSGQEREFSKMYTTPSILRQWVWPLAFLNIYVLYWLTRESEQIEIPDDKKTPFRDSVFGREFGRSNSLLPAVGLFLTKIVIDR